MEGADWVGHSYGGRLVAELAARAPERVRRLALLDPALQLPAALCLERAELERETVRFGSAEEAIQARVESGTIFHTPRELLEEEMAEHLVDAGDGGLTFRYCQSTVVAAWGHMAAPCPGAADRPTLLILGERSWMPLDEHARRYEEALGDRARVVRVPGGHVVLWDALEETGRRPARLPRLAPAQRRFPRHHGFAGTPAHGLGIVFCLRSGGMTTCVACG